MYVIMNIKTGEYVWGTDFNYSPYRQRISDSCAIIFETEEDVRREFKRRQCDKDYRMCKVKLDILETLEI